MRKLQNTKQQAQQGNTIVEFPDSAFDETQKNAHEHRVHISSIF